MGTELAPDWSIHGGAYDWGLNWEDRLSHGHDTKLNAPTAQELERATQNRPDPDARFHYRYQAASLAWEAAKLMPDNCDETARVLCTAGTWLKLRDPDTADLFYKALVRRCRKTAIGEQADWMRWFPALDENGNPKPYQPKVKIEPAIELTDIVPARDETATGGISEPGSAGTTVYIVQAGDSLGAIATAYTASGREVTVEAILAANPGLVENGLRIGQKLKIPEADLIAPEAE